MLSPREREVLGPYFTNLDDNVFCLTNLPEVVKGALFSRYSRSPKGLRRILLDEFIQDPEMQFSSIVGGPATQMISIKKAEEFYDRVLVGYGDDSVAELGGAHVALEGVSNLATKALEDCRIGISPLEKSTRYVRFDQKSDGEYQFYREPGIMASRHADLYLRTCDLLFDIYSRLMGPVMEFLMEKNPRGEETERAYESTIRAKACDVLRGLLPASTLTNLGLYGNGRAFEYLLIKMYASPLEEVRGLAGKMQNELSNVIPSFVKRADNEHGKATQKYMTERSEAIETLARPLRGGEASESITLVDHTDETTALAAILYTHSHLPLASLREAVQRMTAGEKERLVDEAMGRRANRRHKPGRALENVHYTFDILANYGAYRDLQRHRMLTQEKQALSTRHGYDMPPEIPEAGFERDFRECMEAAKESFEAIHKDLPDQASYVVPMAFRLRWYMSMSLREAYFLCELRSSRQGHPDYRRIAQQMYLRIKDVHPLLAKHMKFVDMSDYSLERLEAEKKLDRKLLHKA